MPETIRCDMHFHPNFSSPDDETKAVKILDACLQHHINVLLITEHVYKNPKDSFCLLWHVRHKLLQDPRYAGLKDVLLFPGCEYIALEGIELILFHDTVYLAGGEIAWIDETKNYSRNDIRTIIYDVREDFIGHPYKYSVIDIIGIAKKYGFALFAPHHHYTGSGTVRLGRTKEGREKIAQIIANRHIGLEIHNDCFTVMLDSLKKVGVTLPFLEQVRTTPTGLIDDAQPKFLTGGSDAHTIETMGVTIEMPFHYVFTREKVYSHLISNQSRAIIRPQRGLLGYLQSVRGTLATLGIALSEIASENNIKKEIEIDVKKIIESYVVGVETGMPIEDLIKIKGGFSGNTFMLQFTPKQKQRLKLAYWKRAAEQYTQAYEQGLSREAIQRIRLTVKGIDILDLLTPQQKDRITRALRDSDSTIAERYTRAFESGLPVENIKKIKSASQGLAIPLSSDQKDRISTSLKGRRELQLLHEQGAI